MSFCQLHWFSNVLQKQVATNVILPDAGNAPFPVFYLLHGLSDDHTIWLRRTRIEVYAAWYPMIIVMPDGYRGFYTNNEEGPAYADYIARELPAQIERLFPARRDREGRCIGGLSMGGYGALRTALGFPDLFVSATSHSGALMHARREWTKPEHREMRQIFGERPEGSDHDLVHLAARAQSAGKLPRIRLDCGTEDYLLEDNRDFHAALERLGVPHEYQEYPGTHDWDYWDVHVNEALEFHARATGIKA